MFTSIVLTVFCSLFFCFNGYCAENKGVVTKKMIELAKKLTVKGYGDRTKLDITTISVLEVGKNKGQGLPVRFKIKGQETYKDLEDYPPGYDGGFPVYIRGTVDKTRPYSNVKLYRYSKDEFDKLVVCVDGGYACLKDGEEVPILYRMEANSHNSPNSGSSAQKALLDAVADRCKAGFCRAEVLKIVKSYAIVLLKCTGDNCENDVAYLKKTGKKWAVVTQGTGIGSEELLQSGFPEAVVSELMKE